MNPLPISSPENVIRPFGYSVSDCGYCKGERASLLPGYVSPNDSSKSWGMLADVMTPKSYEEFLARGWRRSGIHMYKPCNFESCCPTLTIRLLASRFQMTKSQSKVMRKMQNLLSPKERRRQKQKKNLITEEEKIISTSGVLNALSASTKQALAHCLPNENSNQNLTVTFKVRKQSKQERKQKKVKIVSSICAHIAGRLSIQRQTLVQGVTQSLILPKDNNFGGLVSISDVKAHEASGQIIVTLQLLGNRIPTIYNADASMHYSDDDDEEDKLADWYHRTTQKPLMPEARRVTVQTMPAHESALDPRVFRLYTRYQNVVHDDIDPFSTEQHHEPPVSLPDLDWGNAPIYFLDRVESILNQFCLEHNMELHNTILANYYSFYQFLVEAPFPFYDGGNQPTPGTPPRCGNYHQHYKIGDFLIAVGVVDILPSGLSSVYLFYDPSFSHQLVALGKYAILKEVEYTEKELKLPHYYLGYYIESCQKMRYKAEYKPSQLLCPKFYKWVNADTALLKLKHTPRHVCPFVDDEEDSDNRRNLDYSLDQIQMDIGAGLNVTFNMLQDNGKQVVKPILEEFIEEAGPKLCADCLVKLS
jgi:arginine-tRNA-protein transferase